MAKTRQRTIRIIEKFRRNAEKDKDRARGLIEKCSAADASIAPVLGELAERLKQKELQASGEIVWAGQQIELARAARKAEEKAGKKNKSKGKLAVVDAE
ncbi:MAG TPA: hypothetical protein PKA55_01465 [Rhodoblastus sp.]|nr:hypothetical protein [Rhodoblastus sp.]